MRGNKLDFHVNLVHFLGEALGPDYEVALQEISDSKSHIVAIVNNHISKREVGAPLTDLALQLIKDEKYLDNDYIVNYQGKSKENQHIRSSTYFVKEENKLLGLLCINYDCSNAIKLKNNFLNIGNDILAFADTITKYSENKYKNDDESTYIENFSESIAELIDTAAGVNLTTNPLKLSGEDNMRIVAELDAKGVFQLKGAITEVSQILKISEPTLYRYLKKVNQKNK